MSCFESSKFLKNPQVMNQAVLIKACQELGWKYEIRQDELIILNANQKEDLKGDGKEIGIKRDRSSPRETRAQTE